MLALLLATSSALALPGTHGPAVSTWDTRASSVVLDGSTVWLSGASLRRLSYNTNFSSTSGRLSSQFGLHAVFYEEEAWKTGTAGVSGTATTLFLAPLTGRRSNGLPELGLGAYLSPSPTVLIGGERNFLSLPLAGGVGLPWSPLDFLVVTPFVGGSLGLDFDTKISPYTLDEAEQQELSEDVVGDILAESVKLEAYLGWTWSGGVAVTAGLGRAALNLRGTVGRHGLSGGQSQVAAGMGLSVTLQWDRIVDSVLLESEPREVAAGAQEASG